MRALASRGVKHALLRAGWHARRLRGNPFPGVAVLCYHGVRADDAPEGAMPFEGLHVRAGELDAHCRFLKANCEPISLERWREAERGGAPVPARSALVTFDDGYRSVVTLALPILKRHGVPAVVFACSGPIEKRRRFWFDAVAAEKGEATVEEMKGKDIENWDKFIEAGARNVSDGEACAPMRVDELRAMAEEPLIEIGAHTESHPILSRIPLDQRREQIARNKADLERWAGRAIRAFAYPNGRPGIDYDEATAGLLGEAGFDFAFTTAPGFAGRGESALERPRFMMLAGVGEAELAHRLAVSWRR